MPCGVTVQVTAVANREQDVDHTDHADIEIRVLPVLPRERTGEIVRDQLRARGWEDQPDGSLRKQIGDAVAVLPADSSTVRVTLSDGTTVTADAKVTDRVQEGAKAAAQTTVNARAAAEAERKLADRAELAKRDLEAKTAAKLLEVWQGVRGEIDEVINATTKQALQQRAGELGSIESVAEEHGDHGYEVTITVRT